MSEVKEKFNNLINEQNLWVFDGPFVVRNFLKNIEDYLNWNTLNEAINSDVVDWRLIKDNKESFDIPQTLPLSTGIRQQNKQFILDHVNNGSTFLISRCCILNDSFKSLISDIQKTFPVASDVHIYGSKITNSKTFPPHTDRYSIFVIQAIGDTDWKVYKNRISNILLFENYEPKREELIPALEVTLSPGDLLYIPPRAYHGAFPSMPRLSMSIPCISLDYFDLQNHLPGFDQVVNRLPPDVNKYEF